MKPRIGDRIIFATCTERAVIRYFVRDIAVCSSNKYGILLAPLAEILKNHRKESKSWRADVHYHFDIYDVEGKHETPDESLPFSSLDIARPGRDFAEGELSARTISPDRRRADGSWPTAETPHEPTEQSVRVQGVKP